MKELNGRVAAITGAASGIGRAVSIELAKAGCHLAVSDVDSAGLAETVGLVEGLGVKVTSELLDVGDRDAVFAWADKVVDEHGSVNLIVNNAGVALGATAAGVSDENFRWLMEINFWGVVNGTQAFMPHLVEAGEGHVVNISSIFGLISIPTQSAYNASKFAVRGFTDALRIELDAAGGGVSATTVHPGGIKTNIARKARIDASVAELDSSSRDAGADFDKVARTTPEQAAKVIVAGVRRNRRRVLIGADAKFVDLLSRLPAGLYQRGLVRIVRRRASAS